MNKIYDLLLNKFSDSSIEKIETIKNDYNEFKYTQEPYPEAALREKHAFNEKHFIVDESPLMAEFYCGSDFNLKLSYTSVKDDYDITLYVTNDLNALKEKVSIIELLIEKDKQHVGSLVYMVEYDIVTSASKNLKIFETDKHLFSTLLSYVGSNDIKEKIELLNLVNDVTLDTQYSAIVVDLLSKMGEEKNLEKNKKINKIT